MLLLLLVIMDDADNDDGIASPLSVPNTNAACLALSPDDGDVQPRDASGVRDRAEALHGDDDAKPSWSSLSSLTCFRSSDTGTRRDVRGGIASGGGGGGGTPGEVVVLVFGCPPTWIPIEGAAA